MSRFPVEIAPTCVKIATLRKLCGVRAGSTIACGRQIWYD